MSKPIPMRHPQAADDEPIIVPACGVETMKRIGWQVVEQNDSARAAQQSQPVTEEDPANG